MMTPSIPAVSPSQRSCPPALTWSPLLDAMLQGVLLVDAEGQCLGANPAAAGMLGLAQDAFPSLRLPQPWLHGSAADGSAIPAEEWPSLIALRTGKPVHRKAMKWVREDGMTLWLAVSAEPLQGGGVLLSLEDMTEQRAQAWKLERLSQLYSALSQINQAIVWSSTRQALLDKICAVMVEFGKFNLAWIAWDNPETHEVRVASQYGDRHGYFTGLEVRSDRTVLGLGGPGMSIREGRTCVLNDFLASPAAAPWHASAIRAGIASSASIPIRDGGKVCGALVVYAAEKYFFGPQELALLEEAAGDVTFALDNFALKARRQQAEQALAESEFFFRESQRAAAIGSYKMDTATGLLKTSEVLDTILGIDASYPRSVQGWLDLVHPDDRTGLVQYVKKRVIADQQPFAKEYRILRKRDGETRWVNGLGEYKVDDQGRVLSMTGTIQDITERKCADQRLMDDQHRLQRAEQVTGIGNWELDISTRRMRASMGARNLYGLQGNEWSLPEVQRLVLPEYRPMLDEALTGLIRDQKPYDLEFRLQRATDREVRDIHSIAEYDPNRHLIFGVVHDITERKRLASALERRLLALTRPVGDLGGIAFHDLFNLADIQRLQDDFAQATGVASIITHPDGSPITKPSNFTQLCGALIRQTRQGCENCFKSAVAIGGYHPDGPRVHCCTSAGLWDAEASIFVDGQHIANWLIGQVRNATQTPESMAAHARNLGMDEQSFLDAFKSVPIMPLERLKEIAQALFTLANQLSNTAYQNIQQARFISERNAAEAEIRRMTVELEQRVQERTAQLETANKEMEAFSYSVSHDLRAPLRGIDGFSQILLEDHRDQLDAAGQEHLHRIRSGVQRMGQLIEDLLKLSQISRSEVSCSEIDLSALCKGVLADLALAHPERQVETSVMNGLRVRGDRRLLLVALENLLGNAWKYTSKVERARITVAERTAASGSRCFSIRDNGAGFDMAYAGKLFQAFQRLHPAKDFEGTGIGLAIVQRIIHRHGGEVWAEAEPAQGATFFFTLPSAG